MLRINKILKQNFKCIFCINLVRLLRLKIGRRNLIKVNLLAKQQQPKEIIDFHQRNHLNLKLIFILINSK